MLLNLSIIVRSSIFFLLIFLSIIFLLLGYKDLSKIKPVNQNNSSKITKFNKTDINPKKQIKFDDLLLDSSNKIISEKKKNKLEEKEIILIVKKNDTFSKIIDPFIKSKENKQKIINSINKEFDLTKLNIGQKIFIYLINFENNKEIKRIIIPLNFDTDLVLVKDDEISEYFSEKVKIEIVKDVVSKKYNIINSIFEDGLKAKVPLEILAELIRLYSFDIDFQRDIKKNNKVEIMYEIFFNDNRELTSYGNIQYANLIFMKNNIEYFIFKTSDGYIDYFNRKGKNVRKTLMKTPLDGAKISSNFGLRKHPILGYNKKHLGVDFAAPKGTPVYAAGNGIIEYVGRNGAYGKYIRIRHNNSYKTAYAHLNSYNKGISKSLRVKQGQIIGYVGSTGRSTGPHLHYEVIYEGKRINPMKMKLPSGKSLKKKELEKFKNESNTIYSNFLFGLYE